MENKLFIPGVTPNAEKQDDVLVLSHIFALPSFHYVDINLQEQFPHILSRWPLLAEFAHSDGLDAQSSSTAGSLQKE
ncbi:MULTISPECIES: cellulose biosynthesis protein BcsR [Sodalis]|uniref:Cellulose biosynthesis protein BcsR n=1 Tax=Sodalis ligni TaxID=2697027 RepID=A0A4V2Q3N8_9GAMM|nr:cellulose biosynthesis protein BcsR [Sodalis ligni]TCL07468.1 cellulose biosynthesis protein BcsR [Sodalis ligni]